MALTIEAKLSSVRIMSAASLATSVPVMPMAMPMSARRRAGASFTPSPVTATTSPFALSAETTRSLSSGETRAKMTSSPDASKDWSTSSVIRPSSTPVTTRPWSLGKIPNRVATDLAVRP